MQTNKFPQTLFQVWLWETTCDLKTVTKLKTVLQWSHISHNTQTLRLMSSDYNWNTGVLGTHGSATAKYHDCIRTNVGQRSIVFPCGHTPNLQSQPSFWHLHTCRVLWLQNLCVHTNTWQNTQLLLWLFCYIRCLQHHILPWWHTDSRAVLLKVPKSNTWVKCIVFRSKNIFT